MHDPLPDELARAQSILVGHDHMRARFHARERLGKFQRLKPNLHGPFVHPPMCTSQPLVAEGRPATGGEPVVGHADRPYRVLFGAGLWGVQLSSSAEKLAAKVLANVAPAPPTDGPAGQPLVVKADHNQSPAQAR